MFSAGFALGTLRVLWVVPRVGTRTAELMEAPVMLAVTALAARWIVRRLEVPSMWTGRLSMGCIALALLLIAESALVLGLRGLSIREYFATVDAIAGTVYYVLLGVFAVMPMFVERTRDRGGGLR